VANEWLNVKKDGWSRDYFNAVKHRLWMYVVPFIGAVPINDVKPSDVLGLLKKIEDRGARDTCHKMLAVISQVFMYAKIRDDVSFNPCDGLSIALKPRIKNHYPAIVDPAAVRKLVADIMLYKGMYSVRMALRIAPFVFVRAAELRGMRWDNVSLDDGLWIIPASFNKQKRDHVVPLSYQVVNWLAEVKSKSAPGGWVFKGRAAGRQISENTLNVALHNLGYSADQVTTHGFRATARTLLDEALHYPVNIIEHQLGHVVRDPLGRAYNRPEFLKERSIMMQNWADWLLLKPTAKISNVVSLFDRD